MLRTTRGSLGGTTRLPAEERNQMASIQQSMGDSARPPDPYAGGDLSNAERLSAPLWTLLVLLVVVLLPTSPPEEPSKAAGWAIAGVLVALGIVLIDLNRRRRISSWGLLLATGYAVAAGLGVMQWVAGGLDNPYNFLLLLPVVFVAATHPPRRTAFFLGFVFAVLVAPLAYDGWDKEVAVASGASFVIWCGLAIGGILL